MTKERALRLARKWSQGYVCSLQESEAQEYHELVVSLLTRPQNKSPAHIDKEALEPCEWCCDEVIFDSEDMKLEMQHPLKDSPEIVKPNYCPMCGRPLTPKAWAELEKRIGGAV